MSPSRRARWLLVLALLALVAAWSVEASAAQLSVFRSAPVPALAGLDAPVQDELATQELDPADGPRPPAAQLGAGPPPSGRLAPPAEPLPAAAGALRARATRAPPAG